MAIYIHSSIAHSKHVLFCSAKLGALLAPGLPKAVLAVRTSRVARGMPIPRKELEARLRIGGGRARSGCASGGSNEGSGHGSVRHDR